MCRTDNCHLEGKVFGYCHYCIAEGWKGKPFDASLIKIDYYHYLQGLLKEMDNGIKPSSD